MEREQLSELQQAFRDSVSYDLGLRPMVGPEGPFAPAGLLNAGNSCFWNALLQVLFFAAPQWRIVLFQMEVVQDSVQAQQADRCWAILSMMRDLFVEMDMGLTGAIDAGQLYRCIFETSEEADVSEQVEKFFALAKRGGYLPLQAVSQQLFGGELIEELESGAKRQVPLEFFQLDLCVTKPQSLPELLEDHVHDLRGSIVRISYRLPPILWLNLDRFRFDRCAMRGVKRRLRVTFPKKLNAWMLSQDSLSEASEKSVNELLQRRRGLQSELMRNRSLLRIQTTQDKMGEATEETEEARAQSKIRTESLAERELLAPQNEGADLESRCESSFSQLPDHLWCLAERQEELLENLRCLEEELFLLAEQRGLVYDLRAVIVHRGILDTGHYFTYARHGSYLVWVWCVYVCVKPCYQGYYKVTAGCWQPIP